MSADAIKQQPVIPLTPILEHYYEVSKLSRENCKTAVAALADDPSPLVHKFVDSVEVFRATYSNAYESIRSSGERSALPDPPAVIGDTPDVAAWLESREDWWQVSGPESWRFRYVFRELSVMRTTGGAVFDPEPEGEEKKAAGRALQPDLLLVAEDGTPIVGEVKITKETLDRRGRVKQGSDKNPFSALVQALAGIAHLATPSQYDRLLNEFSGTFKARFGHAPRLDAALLLVDFDPGMTHMAAILEGTKAVAKLLPGTDAGRYLRDVHVVNFSLESGSPVMHEL